MVVLIGVLLLAIVVLTATLLHLLAEFAVARGLAATPLWRRAPALLRAASAAARDDAQPPAARTAAGAALLCTALLLALTSGTGFLFFLR
ncbi:MAG TPA: hypothetical protein VFQ84_12630 [Arenimonas sp.]|uniref:hypothetical protein n=1 Tax=Arenimonas sp. TaxID=1872635 RepID=UPI002D7E27C9|nr:hypothetical protein [Arenimonas sp.]HEU0154178.1 hypothetical protein [Arenimonas sp.]